MKSLWNDTDAAAFAGDDLAMRVYTSRLLGASEDLVMHGGGNTSVKGRSTDFFGNATVSLNVNELFLLFGPHRQICWIHAVWIGNVSATCYIGKVVHQFRFQ